MSDESLFGCPPYRRRWLLLKALETRSLREALPLAQAAEAFISQSRLRGSRDVFINPAGAIRPAAPISPTVPSFPSGGSVSSRSRWAFLRPRQPRSGFRQRLSRRACSWLRRTAKEVAEPQEHAPNFSLFPVTSTLRAASGAFTVGYIILQRASLYVWNVVLIMSFSVHIRALLPTTFEVYHACITLATRRTAVRGRGSYAFPRRLTFYRADHLRAY
jgi:hypothetical protein